MYTVGLLSTMHDWLELPPSDAVHAVVQPAGKAAAPEMVRAPARQGEEEDLQGPGPNHTSPEAQDVQLLGVEGPQDCVQEVSEYGKFNVWQVSAVQRASHLLHQS